MTMKRLIFDTAPRGLAFRLGLCGLALACGCFDSSDIHPIPDVSEGGIDVPQHAPPPEPFVVGSDIRDITSDDENLYWVEFGSYDELGNYLDDGALRSKPLDGGDVRTLAGGLSGPVNVDVTDAHAYVL